MTEDFLDRGPIPPSIDIMRYANSGIGYLFDYSTLRNIQDYYTRPTVMNESLVQNLSNAECIEAYGPSLITAGRSNVLAVTSSTTAAKNTSLLQIYLDNFDSVYEKWVCQDLPVHLWTHFHSHTWEESRYSPGPSSYPGGISFCDVATVARNASNWTLAGHKIDYCLSKVEPDRCKLLFSTYILAVVVLMNAAKAAGMIWTALSRKQTTLVTVGDAVKSFLDRPDELTKGRCLMAEKDVSSGPLRWTKNGQAASDTPPPTRTVSGFSGHHWFVAVSTKRWLMTVALFVASLTTVGVLLQYAIDELAGYLEKPSSVFSQGFGQLDIRALIDIGLPSKGLGGLVSDVLLSNLPQLICSSLSRPERLLPIGMLIQFFRCYLLCLQQSGNFIAPCLGMEQYVHNDLGKN